ncbi:shikimate kinase [Candidatus Daviesbacteria bacterium]|nr:shikimate kinase [Candidatus Daviesbacteria bacterium]
MKIVLIGFMGSGKTTVAKLLAKKLRLKAIDMDDLALKKSGRKSINEIFEKDGEEKFRQIEYQVAQDLADCNDAVISTGGGVVVNTQLMSYLTKNSLVFYLKADFDKLKIRVRMKKIIPPLFKNEALARNLYKTRQPLYESYANMNILTDRRTIEMVATDITAHIGETNGRE